MFSGDDQAIKVHYVNYKLHYRLQSEHGVISQMSGCKHSSET